MADLISRVHPPKAVSEIAETLERAGYETWCVGGAVRDALLGHTHLDWDLATQATPDVVRGLFRRTVPLGVEFGTVGVLDRSGVQHEVTTFRRDVRTDGRHAEVEFGASLDEDLARRDFTINAIAYSPRLGVLHDPFEGRRDLERKVLRAVGVPTDRMHEDRLRALRALRFAARFGFEIEPHTWRAIVDSARFLTRLSRERVKQELEKTMEQVARPSRALQLWRSSGALAALIPELMSQPDVAFVSADHIALPEDTDNEGLAASRKVNRLATMFLGVEEGTARRVLRELRFSNREIGWIGSIAGTWRELDPRIRAVLAREEGATDVDLRRWVARTGRTEIRDLLRVAYARWAAERAYGGEAPALARASALYRRALRTAYRDPISLDDLAVDGNDLSDIGIPPGPQVGTTLRRLLAEVVEDPARNTREYLLSLARAIARASQPPGSDR
jgi:tRNA nucleotidyltransferase (CCA-adding enzyme)